MREDESFETFMERIRRAAEEAPANQQIAEYLYSHLRDVSFMSSAELARETGVSQASITRFSVAMGFSGFGDFERQLQSIVREEWRAPERTAYLRPALSERTDPLLAQEIANLENMTEILESDAMQRLVDVTASAQQVVLAGARIAGTLLPYAAYCLSKVRGGVVTATPGSLAWENLVTQDPEQVLVIGWVFPRYPRVLLDWMEEARSAGVRVAALTDRWMSPALSIADPAVIVPVSNASLLDSYVGPMFAANYLTRRVAERLPAVRERLERIEERDARQGVYWSRPKPERENSQIARNNRREP